MDDPTIAAVAALVCTGGGTDSPVSLNRPLVNKALGEQDDRAASTTTTTAATTIPPIHAIGGNYATGLNHNGACTEHDETATMPALVAIGASTVAPAAEPQVDGLKKEEERVETPLPRTRGLAAALAEQEGW